jgi:hypothetical protein
MSKKFLFPVVFLVVAAFCLAVSPRAFANTIPAGNISINFAKVTGDLNGSSSWTSAHTKLTSWTQVGPYGATFTVTPGSGNNVDWNPNQGTTGLQSLANVSGYSSLTSGPGQNYDGSVGTSPSVLTVTDSGGIFYFVGVDLIGTSSAGYSIVGMDGGTQEFSISGGALGSSPYTNIAATLAQSKDPLTSLSITINGSIDRLDWIELNETPEPTSLLLLGTGLLGLGALVRRKMRA